MGKGEQTRALILGEAVALASQVGIEGLTIGVLADRLKLSKSGLFAHFASREGLQLAVVEAAQADFVARAIKPALTEPRGLPRLRRLFDLWLANLDLPERPGGCPLLAAAVEFDDQPGPIRDRLAEGHRHLLATLARASAQAVECGHLAADTDAEQLAFELFGLVLAAHHHLRLLGDGTALARARRGFAARIERCRGPALSGAISVVDAAGVSGVSGAA